MNPHTLTRVFFTCCSSSSPDDDARYIENKAETCWSGGGGGRYKSVEKPNPGSAEQTGIIAARPNESISSQTVLEGGQSG